MSELTRRIPDFKCNRTTPDEPQSKSRQDMIAWLRSKPKKPGETFPWELVMYHIQNPSRFAHKNKLDDGTELPEALPGYEWHWVDDMVMMNGQGGWLEVNLEIGKQAKFILKTRS